MSPELIFAVAIVASVFFVIGALMVTDRTPGD